MKAKHTDLEKLEQLYKESGNQLVVLYGRRGCQKEELIKEFCDGKKFFLLQMQTGIARASA